MNLFDSVRIKKTGEVGFISSFIGDGRYAVNTGEEDNQPICDKDELEIINDEEEE